MTSFVISTSDKKKREDYIVQFCQQLEIDKYDITVIGKDSSKNINSIGIDEVKTLQAKIFLKPIKSAIKAVVMEDAELLTIEAQNAMLKLLEEPPDHTIIIVSADRKDVFLPTILSRCQVIELEREPLSLSDEELMEFTAFTDTLNVLKIGERLKKAEVLSKDKDNLINWIEKLIFTLRGRMLEKNAAGMQEAIQIKLFQELHTLLKTTNVNQRLAIENTLLSL